MDAWAGGWIDTWIIYINRQIGGWLAGRMDGWKENEWVGE